MSLLEIRLLTVKDYHTMIKAGIFNEDERVELIGGQIIKIAAKGTGHSAASRTESRWLSKSNNFVRK